MGKDKKESMLVLVIAYHTSGLTRSVFAKQNKISVPSLTYWCRQLKQEDQTDSATSPSFIELPPQLPITHANPTQQVSRQPQLELVLISGMRILVY